MPSRPEEKAGKRRSKMPWKILGGIAAAALLGWFVYASVNIVVPRQGNLDATSDVVVSLAPQESRLPTAQQLVAEGVADTLLISYFDHDPMNNMVAGDEQTSLSEYCEPGAPPTVMCFTPQEDATIGEVHAIADIAKAESWETMTVVTDPFHAFRTRYIFSQCLGQDIEVNVVFSDRELTVPQWIWHVVYENVAFFKAAWQTTTRC